MGAHTRLMPPHRRELIEAEIERNLQRVTLLIARLDRADEPTMDMEDDDPGGDTLDRGEGEGHMGQGLYRMLPAYGLDQSAGPTNLREAERERYRRMMAD